MFSSLSGVDINIDVCMQAAGGRIETKNKGRRRKKKGKKGDRDNVTKSVCARSHKTKDQQRKTENSSMDDPIPIEMTTNIHKIPCLLIQFFH